MALILVIDDSEVMRALVRRMLERDDHSVIEAQDGEVGLYLFTSCAPDLVVTDLIMPNKEGIETIKEMRRMRPDARIIAMSGSIDVTGGLYLRVASKLGADEVLEKPFQPAQLLRAVDRLLGAVPAPPPQPSLLDKAVGGD